MSKVVNLRQARKSKARAEKRAKSDRKTGTGAKQAAAKKDAERHEGHRLPRDDQ